MKTVKKILSKIRMSTYYEKWREVYLQDLQHLYKIFLSKIYEEKNTDEELQEQFFQFIYECSSKKILPTELQN